MMQYCFPSVVFWYLNVGQIDFGDLENKCVVNTEWNCNVKTSRGVEYDWNEFLQTIQPHFKELPYKKPTTLNFGCPWMNVYGKGSYQEAHQHVSTGEQLSYCYFSKLPEGSGKFGFWNELFRLYSTTNLYQNLNIDVMEWASPEVKEGDLLIFPSFLIHQVTYHGVDDLRVTVSGNVRMVS